MKQTQFSLRSLLLYISSLCVAGAWWNSRQDLELLLPIPLVAVTTLLFLTHGSVWRSIALAAGCMLIPFVPSMAANREGGLYVVSRVDLISQILWFVLSIGWFAGGVGALAQRKTAIGVIALMLWLWFFTSVVLPAFQ